MRYESFYPFTSNQPASLPPQQQEFAFQPYPGPMQNPTAQQIPPNYFAGPGVNQPASEGLPGQGLGQVPGQGQVPSKMDAYIQTANQFMNTAQQFAPVVEQFAPMVRNLPAMWRMYKGFQSLPNVGGPATGANVARTATQATASSLSPQSSAPRIFQPPGR